MEPYASAGSCKEAQIRAILLTDEFGEGSRGTKIGADNTRQALEKV